MNPESCSYFVRVVCCFIVTCLVLWCFFLVADHSSPCLADCHMAHLYEQVFLSCSFYNRFHYCRMLLHVLGKPCGEIRGESRWVQCIKEHCGTGRTWWHIRTDGQLTLRKVSFGWIKRTNKISSKQPKSCLLLTFRPLSEAFIRRSWY